MAAIVIEHLYRAVREFSDEVQGTCTENRPSAFCVEQHIKEWCGFWRIEVDEHVPLKGACKGAIDFAIQPLFRLKVAPIPALAGNAQLLLRDRSLVEDIRVAHNA